jgi:feruloyl esterase
MRTCHLPRNFSHNCRSLSHRSTSGTILQTRMSIGQSLTTFMYLTSKRDLPPPFPCRRRQLLVVGSIQAALIKSLTPLWTLPDQLLLHQEHSTSTNMLLHSVFTCAIAILGTIHPSAATSKFEQQCNALADTLSIPNATIWFTEYVPSTTNITLPGNNITCARPFQVAPKTICRVALYVATSSNSGISMEAWLPLNWTGRFLSTGNGGISGCTQYEDIAYGTSLGFATIGANNGHNGTGGDAFLNNPDVVLDFSWRSLHTSTVVGKSITQSFYGKPHTKAYYLGCSTGGRQGFQSAQMFPEDFNGIVAGAPAFRFNYLNAWSGSFYPIFRDAGPDGFPPPTAWPALDSALLAQCDTLDNAADGIIEDPELCNFRPEALICSSTTTNTSTCITGKQAATIRALLSPLYGENGTFIYPRMQPGPTILPALYSIYAQAQFPYTTDWFRYAVFNDPNFDTDNITPSDWKYAWNKNPGDINTWSGDLAAFSGRGSKILHYHGQVDIIISSAISPLYYDHVSRTMNIPADEIDDFYRFFRISGMSHCSGGVGATFIGQNINSAVSTAPEENVLMAMVRWVEEGIAPETVTGTAVEVDEMGAPVLEDGNVKALWKRRHCRYPRRNVYQGGKKGDWRDPKQWKCVV